ncbi:MAG: type III-B CRISPR module RAMP protein Cmr4 [Clostridia bacterium]|nr:type III-B CRISPR module RAMP protein Cmr4 [Clostridia bacterium]
MKSAVLGLFSETSLHPGMGQVVGVVDLPVAREKATGYPVIVGSSFKGALRDRAEQVWEAEEEKVKRIFGEQDGAGSLLVTDARLILLPVRSLHGHYKWVTCPYLLERLERDLKLAGINKPFSIPYPVEGEAVVAEGQGTMYLEELSYTLKENAEAIDSLVKVLADLILHPTVKERLLKGIAVISDKEFSHFARFGLSVNARNVLNKETKTSENLWYEETIPPDTLFYALLFDRDKNGSNLKEVMALFGERPYIQVGGNETVGQGWCAVSFAVDGGEMS